MVSFATIDDRAARSASANSSPTMGTTPVTPVAVIGMACRLPGGIDSPERLWEALLRGDDLVTEIPPDRWDADDYYDPEPGVPGRSVSKWGAFLDDVAGFDSEFFGISEREATAIDPQHRLMLETSWEAMEHAGLSPRDDGRLADRRVRGNDARRLPVLAADAQAVEGPYGFIGNTFSMASGRVAYALGLHGPALTVDTACSSGLTAVHLACRSLHERESDLALAGGVALALDPRKWAAGRPWACCLPQDAAMPSTSPQTGSWAARAAPMVLLKRLPDAQRDGDRILAVIRGTAAKPRRPHREHCDTVATRADRGLSGGVGCSGCGCEHRGHGGGTRHRHPYRRPHRIRQPGRGIRPRRSLRACSREDQLRTHPVGLRRSRADEGGARAAAWCCSAESCTSPACPMRWRRSTPISLCRRQIRRGPPTVTHPGGRRCPHTECRGPMCTPFWSRLPRAPKPCTARRGGRNVDDGTTAVSAVVHFGRRTAPHRRPAG